MAVSRLHDAISRGDVDDVRVQLRICGKDVNTVYMQHTAMTRALESGSDDVIVDLILSHEEFIPNAKNQSGRTATYEAAKEGRTEVLKRLLRMAGFMNDADRRGVTPISACAYYNRHETARVLLSAGADVNIRDCDGDTALHRACAYGSKDVVDLLLADGRCDVNCRNRDLRTPLMRAFPSAYDLQVKGQPMSTAFTICRGLLQAGSDVFARESLNGGTALHERVRQDDVAGLCLLLDHTRRLADVSDMQGITPLQLAVGLGHHEQAFSLLHYGADPKCLTTAAATRKDIRDARSGRTCMMSYMWVRAGSSTKDPDPVNSFHKIRFLHAVMSSVFVTVDGLSWLVDLHLLTDELVQDVLQQSARTGHVTGSGGRGSGGGELAGQRNEMDAGWSPGCDAKTAEERPSDRDREMSKTTTVSGHTKQSSMNNAFPSDNTSSNDSTTTTAAGVSAAAATSYSFYETEALACALAVLRHSLSLKHQCRLALRRILGTSLVTSLPALGLPHPLQNYLSLGVDAARRDPLRVVELHVAITENNLVAVKDLLESGVDPDSPLMERTPLTRAMEVGRFADDASGEKTKCAPIVEGSGVTTPLSHHGASVTAGDLQRDAHVQVSDDVTENEANRGSDVENDDVITLLLRHGATLTAHDPQGDTPLHVAVRRGAMFLHHLLKVMEKAGCLNYPGVEKCALRARNAHGCTPLQLAASYGDTVSLRWLLKHFGPGITYNNEYGASAPSSREEASSSCATHCQVTEDKGGISTLHCAAAAGAVPVVTALLAQGVPVDIRDWLGNTPLHVAACRGRVYSDRRQDYCSQRESTVRRHMLRCWPNLPNQRQEEEGSHDNVLGQGEDEATAVMNPFEVAQDEGMYCQRSGSSKIASSKNCDFEKGIGIQSEVSTEGLCSDNMAAQNKQADLPEFSHPLTIEILLSHGADLNACNVDAQDVSSLAFDYGYNVPTVN